MADRNENVHLSELSVLLEKHSKDNPSNETRSKELNAWAKRHKLPFDISVRQGRRGTAIYITISAGGTGDSST